MVTRLFKIFFFVMLIVTTLSACSYPLPQDTQITEATAVTLLTEPQNTISPEITLPSDVVTVISDENFGYLTSEMELHIFILMFGEKCVRYTDQKSYAIIQKESGEEYFVFFDKNDRLNYIKAVDSGVFLPDDAVLDFLEDNTLLEELYSFDCFRSGAGDKYILYTQDGVFLLSYGYTEDDAIQRLANVEYYRYEDIDKAEAFYADNMWYILPEDRNRERTGDGSLS